MEWGKEEGKYRTTQITILGKKMYMITFFWYPASPAGDWAAPISPPCPLQKFIDVQPNDTHAPLHVK